MIVPVTPYQIAAFAVPVLILIALFVWYRRRRRHVVARVGMILAIPGLLGAALWLIMLPAKLIVVKGTKPGVTMTTNYLLGSGSHTFSDGTTKSLSSDAKVVVVNDTDAPLMVFRLTYVKEPSREGAQPFERTIAPKTVSYLPWHLKYVGPDQEPPKEIESRSFKENVFWLTW
jgi:hypothetical protein